MGASKHIKLCMTDKDIKSGSLAEKLGSDPQVFYNKLNRDTWKFSDVETIANILGCDLLLVDRETGKTY